MVKVIIQTYNFKQFRTRFMSMSDSELVTEYANVCNRISEFENLYESGKCSFDDLSNFLEEAAMVKDYIGNYLAGLYIQDHGFIFSSDGMFFPCGT